MQKLGISRPPPSAPAKSPNVFKLMPEGWLNANESATDICAKAGAIVGPRMNFQETGE
jgi:hypothetical protein